MSARAVNVLIAPIMASRPRRHARDHPRIGANDGLWSRPINGTAELETN
jgi:hypothetical protein